MLLHRRGLWRRGLSLPKENKSPRAARLGGVLRLCCTQIVVLAQAHGGVAGAGDRQVVLGGFSTEGCCGTADSGRFGERFHVWLLCTNYLQPHGRRYL